MLVSTRELVVGSITIVRGVFNLYASFEIRTWKVKLENAFVRNKFEQGKSTREPRLEVICVVALIGIGLTVYETDL